MNRQLLILALTLAALSGCQMIKQTPPTNVPTPARVSEASASEAQSAYHQTGLVDTKGTETLTEKYAYLLPIENDPKLATAMLPNMKWSYLNPDGSLAFEGEFEQGTGFREGLAVVQQGDKYGFLKPDGTFQVKPEFEFADWAGFHDGLCEVRSGETSAYVDKDGEIVIPYQRELYKAGNFRGGLIHYTQGKEEVFLDTEGKERFRTTLAGPFRYGDGFWLAGDQDVTFLDDKGRNVFGKTFASAEPFNDGAAAVESDGRWGLIDKDGKFLVEPAYEQADSPRGDVFAARKDGRWGVVNLKGETVVPFEYDEIGYPSAGAIPVKKGKLWGLYELGGKLLVEPRYTDLHPWRDDRHFIFRTESASPPERK